MFKVFKNFFGFCGVNNRRKFYASLVLGLMLAILEALRVPAIYVMIDAVLKDVVTSKTVLVCLGIMV